MLYSSVASNRMQFVKDIIKLEGLRLRTIESWKSW